MGYKKIIAHILIGITTLLTGCTIGNNLYNQTEGNVADVALRAKQARHISDESGKPEPALVVNNGLYVDKTPISLSKEPGWLRNHIVIRGEELPFSYYARTIAGGGGKVLTRYQVGLDQSAMVSLNYSGTVKGALDLLASKAGFVYNVNGKNIYWQAFVTKTFDIAFVPGSTDYMMGKSQGGGGVQSSATGANAVNAMIDDSASQQYSGLKGSLSVWKDLESSIKQLMSPEGKVMVSEATTSVTVRDKPTNVELISKFVNNMNHNLAKQVLVKVQVLEVTLESDYTYGINWDVLQRAFGNGQWILNANFGTPVSITPFGGGAIPTYGVKGANLITNASGQIVNPNATSAGALINALTQQGKVSIVTEPRVVCLNNQVSVLRIIQQQGYLASVQNTTVPNVNASSSVTSQLTPGTLITGLTLYILPKLMGEKVLLQVNADLSSNGNFKTASSGGSSIQVPNVTQKQFNQRSVIGSGDTLILAGFRQIQNTANAMQLFDSTSLGGRGALQNNTETVILITPIILHGSV